MSEELARKLEAFGREFEDEIEVDIERDADGRPVAGYATVKSVRAEEKPMTDSGSWTAQNCSSQSQTHSKCLDELTR